MSTQQVLPSELIAEIFTYLPIQNYCIILNKEQNNFKRILINRNISIIKKFMKACHTKYQVYTTRTLNFMSPFHRSLYIGTKKQLIYFLLFHYVGNIYTYPSHLFASSKKMVLLYKEMLDSKELTKRVLSCTCHESSLPKFDKKYDVYKLLKDKRITREDILRAHW